MPPAPGTSIFSESLKAESDWRMRPEGESSDSRKSHYNFYDRGISKRKYMFSLSLQEVLMCRSPVFLIKTFHASVSGYTKNTLNQTSISTRKMWGMVVLFSFSTTKCRCRIQEENRAELVWNLLNSTKDFCRGRTSINHYFSYLPESPFHGNLFPIHSTSSAVLP